MSAVPEKSPTVKNDPAPSLIRSLGFGLMLIAWWILSIELTGNLVFKFIVMRGITRQFAPLTVWTYGITQQWMKYQWLAVVLIIIAILFHYWLWYRRTRYDVFGKWLFKAGFLVLYIILYGFFIVLFIGAELPHWTMPPQISP